MSGTQQRAESVFKAFGIEHVAKLAGLSLQQLRYWAKSDFYRPEYDDGVYSFRDVVALRTISLLRKQVSLQQLRKAAHELHKHRNSPWSELKLYVFKRKVYFKEPDTGKARAAIDGQIMLIELQEIARDLEADIQKLRKRPADKIGTIERHRNIQRNDPVIAGTRIRTSSIWAYHQARYSIKHILREYPTLTEEDVRAAIEYETKADGETSKRGLHLEGQHKCFCLTCQGGKSRVWG